MEDCPSSSSLEQKIHLPKKKGKRSDESLVWTHQHSQSILFVSSLPSSPQCAINIKETIINSPVLAGLLVS
jgi:hypothetical protein